MLKKLIDVILKYLKLNPSYTELKLKEEYKLKHEFLRIKEEAMKRRDEIELAQAINSNLKLN